MSVPQSPPVPGNENSTSCPCSNNESHFHLYQEIESLKNLLNQRDAHIVTLETALIDRKEPPMPSFNQSLQQDIHERLQESHKKLQRVNQALEDKLLRVVDRFESERTGLKEEVNSLSIRLADALEQNAALTRERNQYKNDCMVAVNLLNNGTVDHVLRSLKSSSPTPKKVTTERKTLITTTFPPTALQLVDRSPFIDRKTSVNEEEGDDDDRSRVVEGAEQQSGLRLKQPSQFLMKELNQRIKNTEYSINFSNLEDSIEL